MKGARRMHTRAAHAHTAPALPTQTAHGVELRTYEERCRKYEEEILKVHNKLRKSALIISQLKADHERRETTVEAALHGLRHALTDLASRRSDVDERIDELELETALPNEQDK